MTWQKSFAKALVGTEAPASREQLGQPPLCTANPNRSGAAMVISFNATNNPDGSEFVLQKTKPRNYQSGSNVALPPI